MTVPITPVNAFGASLVIPADGEPANSASILQYVQEIANRIEYVRQRVPGATQIGSPINLRVPLQGFAITPANWANANAPFYNVTVNTSTELWLPLPALAPGVQIRSYQVTINPIGGHAGMPATKPQVRLFRQPNNTLIGTTVSSTVDPSAILGTYETYHDIAGTGLTEVIATGFQYYLVFRNEFGANALAGLSLTDAQISVYGP